MFFLNFFSQRKHLLCLVFILSNVLFVWNLNIFWKKKIWMWFGDSNGNWLATKIINQENVKVAVIFFWGKPVHSDMSLASQEAGKRRGTKEEKISQSLHLVSVCSRFFTNCSIILLSSIFQVFFMNSESFFFGASQLNWKWPIFMKSWNLKFLWSSQNFSILI